MTTYNPLSDFWFWLAFWGFAFVSVFGLALLRLVVPEDPPIEADEDPAFWQRVKEFQISNRPWYYVIPLWLVMAFGIVNACEAFVANTTPIRPLTAMFIMAVGLSYIGGYFFMRFGGGSEINPQLANRISNGILIGVLIACVVMGFLGFRLSLKRSNDIQKEAIEVTKGQVKADTATSPALKRKVDSLLAKSNHTDSLIARSLERQTNLDSKLNEVITNTTPTNHKRR